MQPSSLTIDGLTVDGEPAAITQAYLAVKFLIDNGESEWVVVGTDSGSVRGRTAFRVTPSSSVQLILRDDGKEPSFVDAIRPNVDDIIDRLKSPASDKTETGGNPIDD